MANTNEIALVQQAKSGDKKAYEELVKLHFRRVYHTAVHMMASAQEAEDVTQETFIKAYRAIGKFDGRSSFSTWVYRILINLCLNRLKQLKKWRTAGQGQDPRLAAFILEKETADTETPEQKLQNKRMIVDLVEALDQLSDVLRTTLILVSFENVDYKQAGEILGCSEGTVAWRVFKAREILREKMKRHLT